MGRLEQDYREALDALRFSGAGKERIMNGLMETEKRPVKRKHFRPLRPALIAAVLCLALVGTVFAAGWDWAAFIRHDVSSNGREMFSIDGNSLARYSWADLAVECKEGGRIASDHPSWETAEQYLGLEMPMSRTLEEKGIPQTFRVYRSDPGGDPKTYNCQVQITDECIITDTAYRMEQWYTCIVSSYVLTDKAGPDFSPVWIVRNADVFSTVYEKYVTPGGLETGVISDQNAYWAVFVRDGIGYYVRLSWNNTPIDNMPETQSQGLELLKQVLDGFSLE